MVPLVKENTWTFPRCVWGVIPKALFFFRFGIMKHHTLFFGAKNLVAVTVSADLSAGRLGFGGMVSLQWSAMVNIWTPYYIYIYCIYTYTWSNVPPGDCYCEGGASQWILTFFQVKIRSYFISYSHSSFSGLLQQTLPSQERIETCTLRVEK